MGINASSVNLSSFWVFAFDALYCLRQKVSSLFMASTSSLMNSMLFPRGAVFWQMLWIMLWTNYNSLSVRSPPALMIFYEVSFFFLPPNLPKLIWFLAFSSFSAYFCTTT